MPAPRKQYVDGEFGQLHLRMAAPESSGKRPLYCAHQSPKSGREFQRFMTLASAARTIVAPDYPGYGMSDAPPQESDATIPMYAREMWRVADALGHEKLDLLGNHTGGKVVAEMAMQQPDRVGNIVIISAAILTDAERAEYRDYFSPIPLDDAGTRFSTMWERIVEVRGPGQTLELLSESLLMNMMGGEEYEWGHVAAFNHGRPFEEAIQSLPHRITLLNPADTLSEVTRRAGPLLNNGEIIELPDWGYGFMDAFTEDAVDLVIGKLDASAA